MNFNQFNLRLSFSFIIFANACGRVAVGTYLKSIVFVKDCLHVGCLFMLLFSHIASNSRQ